MKILFILLLVHVFSNPSFAQRVSQVPDSLRKNYKPQSAMKPMVINENVNKDSLMKIKLVQLAMDNPNVKISEANIRIAQEDLALAKLGWLSSISIGANINEFVINNSTSAAFFPKYNLGVMVPFDIVSRYKRQKRVAEESISINQQTLKEKQRYVKREVLSRYEDYKERKELVNLQKTFMEYDYSAYEAAQKSYADGTVSLAEMNLAYQVFITDKAKLVTKERDYNIAVIMLEELIGIPLEDVIK